MAHAVSIAGAWAGGPQVPPFVPTNIAGLKLWLDPRFGITYVQGPVVATGTTPPAVTFAGTPSSSANSIVLTCTGVGTNTTATFSWTLNGVAQAPFTAAATVVLPGTGITATFPVGAYTNTPSADTYTSVVTSSAWQDTQSGGGLSVVQATPTSQPPLKAVDPIYSNMPTFGFSGGFLSVANPVKSQPWTVYILGEAPSGINNVFFDDTNTIFGYSTSGILSLFAGAGLNTGNVSAGKHALAFVLNGTSSAIYVDSAATPAATGNASTIAPGGTFILGSQAAGALPLNGKECIVLSYAGAHTQAQVAQVLAWMRAQHGTYTGTNTLVLDGNSFLVVDSAALATDVFGSLSSFGSATKNNGVSGETTPTMSSLALTATDPYFGTGGNRGNVAVGIEITNDVAVGGASAATAYANIQAYCAARRAFGWKVIITTFLSRSDAGVSGTFNTIRATVNANIQANWPTFADGLADWASDPIMGINGAETNPTYFLSGNLHPNAAGMAILAPYVTAAIKSLGYT